MSVVRITRHPGGPDQVLVHAGPDLREVMGKFPAARYVPDHRAFELAAKLLEPFTQLLRHYKVPMNDARVDQTQSAPPPFQPLPECSGCGTPYRREVADGLRSCTECGLVSPWLPSWGGHTLGMGRDAPTAAADPGARAEQVRELARQAATERAPQGVRAVRWVRCPWCEAPPGTACIAVGSGGRPLTVTDHHAARYEAAGAGRPKVDLRALGERRVRDVPLAAPDPRVASPENAEGDVLSEDEPEPVAAAS